MINIALSRNGNLISEEMFAAFLERFRNDPVMLVADDVVNISNFEGNTFFADLNDGIPNDVKYRLWIERDGQALIYNFTDTDYVNIRNVLLYNLTTEGDVAGLGGLNPKVPSTSIREIFKSKFGVEIFPNGLPSNIGAGLLSLASLALGLYLIGPVLKLVTEIIDE